VPPDPLAGLEKEPAGKNKWAVSCYISYHKILSLFRHHQLLQ